MLITDRFQSRSIARGIDPRVWQYERTVSHLMNSRIGAWGYEFKVYRRVGLDAAAAAR